MVVYTQHHNPQLHEVLELHAAAISCFVRWCLAPVVFAATVPRIVLVAESRGTKPYLSEAGADRRIY
jgi:hypothetical protein